MGNYYSVVWSYGNSLSHHGILGQKWGVRRWQNDDGTLTAAGKIHYRTEQALDDARFKVEKAKAIMTSTTKAQRDETKQYYKALEEGRAKSKAVWDKNLKNPESIKGELENPKLIASTESEGAFERLAYAASADKKVQKQLSKLLSKTDNPAVNDCKSKKDSYQEKAKALDEAFYTYLSKMEKELKRSWTGDGTEAHYAMQKKYPEYDKLTKDYERAKTSFIESAKQLAKTPDFSSIRGNRAYPNLELKITSSEGTDWYERADTVAFNVAYSLIDAGLKGDLLPSDFMEAYDKNGKKIW